MGDDKVSTVFDPLGLFTKSKDDEKYPDAYEDLYNRDTLILIPLNEKHPGVSPIMICQYREKGITFPIISEMAKNNLKKGAYFTIYGRYFGPSDWIFQHMGNGEIRTCATHYPERLGHIVLMREFDPKKIESVDCRRHFNLE
jgi:hypothetical protein